MKTKLLIMFLLSLFAISGTLAQTRKTTKGRNTTVKRSTSIGNTKTTSSPLTKNVWYDNKDKLRAYHFSSNGTYTITIESNMGIGRVKMTYHGTWKKTGDTFTMRTNKKAFNITCDKYVSAKERNELSLVQRYTRMKPDITSTYLINRIDEKYLYLKDSDTNDYLLLMTNKGITSYDTERPNAIKENDIDNNPDINNDIENDTDSIYNVVEQMPSFPGGNAALMNYLSQNIKYPVIAEENNIQGRVVVQFVVGKDGSISNVHVSKSVESSLDEEAVRVTKSMPNWVPGKHDGQAVSVFHTLPITFRLP